MNLHHLLMTTLVVAVPLLPTSAVRAEEGARHEGEKQGYGDSDERLQIPDKLPDLWNLVLEKQAALGEVIRAKELDKVRVTVFQIRDLVQAVPGKSPNLSADNWRKLNESTGRVQTIAKLLDEYAGAWNQAKVEDQAMRLGKMLTYVASLYPPGSLGSGRAAAGPHGGAVVTSGAYRLELVAAQGQLSLFVLDPANQVVAIDKMTAMAMAGPKAETHVPLEGTGGHFTGKLIVPKTGAIPVTVMVALADQNLEGHFVVSDQGVTAEESVGDAHGTSSAEQQDHVK